MTDNIIRPKKFKKCSEPAPRSREYEDTFSALIAGIGVGCAISCVGLLNAENWPIAVSIMVMAAALIYLGAFYDR